jgi:hypothetical protein
MNSLKRALRCLRSDSDPNEQRAATARQGIMKMLACFEEILQEKNSSLSLARSVIDFFKLSSGTHALPPVLVDIGGNDSDGPPGVSEEVICL